MNSRAAPRSIAAASVPAFQAQVYRQVQRALDRAEPGTTAEVIAADDYDRRIAQLLASGDVIEVDIHSGPA